MTSTANNVYTCAECGHLHFLGRELGYEECGICGCEGQEWAKEVGTMTVDVKVFLNRAEDLFSRFGGGQTTYQEGDELEHVITLDVDISDVTSDDLGGAVLNKAYAMTNRGSGTFVGDEAYAQRSLSVGDVLEVLGSRFAVAGIGFVRLGDA